MLNTLHLVQGLLLVLRERGLGDEHRLGDALVARKGGFGKSEYVVQPHRYLITTKLTRE